MTRRRHPPLPYGRSTVLLPLLGFLILPVLWSLPEAVVTSELASAFPTNAGYVAWVSAAFPYLKDPDLPRPYRIPLGSAGAAAMCVRPVALIATVMCLASARTFVVSGAVAAAGVALYFGVEHLKGTGWVEFLTPVPSDSLHESSSSGDDAADLEDVRAVLLAAADVPDGEEEVPTSKAE